eukprot:2752632-Lingulodinium_polyedra.AAC.1
MVRACVRGAFRCVEAANSAVDRIIVQRSSKRCAMMRSYARFAAQRSVMRRARTRHARTISWCARGVCLRSAFRRAEAANCA